MNHRSLLLGVDDDDRRKKQEAGDEAISLLVPVQNDRTKEQKIQLCNKTPRLNVLICRNLIRRRLRDLCVQPVRLLCQRAGAAAAVRALPAEDAARGAGWALCRAAGLQLYRRVPGEVAATSADALCCGAPGGAPSG